LKKVVAVKAESIIGGGDLVSVLSSLEPRSYKLKPNLFISTGGGATLEFLANSTLPGIKALK
jgi:phosphoglycerate kinase